MSDFYYKVVGNELHLSSDSASRSAEQRLGVWPWTGNVDITKVIIDGPIQLPPDSSGLFADLYNLTEIEGLENLDTSQVANMRSMFKNCGSLQNLHGLENWDTSNVTDASRMFFWCISPTTLDLSNWNVSQVNDTNSMFYNCINLTEIDGLENWDVSNVTDMSDMFERCLSLESLSLENWDTSQVKDMFAMFHSCRSLTSLDLSGWTTPNLTDMSIMFSASRSLTEIKGLEGFDVSNVTAMTATFAHCTSLTRLDLASWSASPTVVVDRIFCGCPSLQSVMTADQRIIAELPDGVSVEAPTTREPTMTHSTSPSLEESVQQATLDSKDQAPSYVANDHSNRGNR